PPVTLSRVEDGGRGGSWGSDGNIAFAAGYFSGLSLISAAGGSAQTLTRLDRQKAEGSHRFPHYLPGGGALLFTVGTGGSWDDARIEILKLGTGEKKVLIEGGSDGRYVPTGHVVFLRGGNLMAVPFDLQRLEVTGAPIVLVESILPSRNNTGAAHAALADTGSLVYVPGDQGTARSRTGRSFGWITAALSSRSRCRRALTEILGLLRTENAWYWLLMKETRAMCGSRIFFEKASFDLPLTGSLNCHCGLQTERK